MKKFNKKKTFSIHLILLIILLIFQLFIIAYKSQAFICLYIIPLLTLLFYFILTISYLKTTIELNLVLEKNITLEYNYKSLHSLYNNIRSFKHDSANILTGFGGYININDFSGLKSYYNKILNDYNINNNLASLNSELINEPAVYNILAKKYYLAIENNIKFIMQIFIDFKNLKMNSYDFSRILGIFLDNAIEATQKCESKIINLEIKDYPIYKYQSLIIENTFNNPDIDLDKLSDKHYTTKSTDKNAHGYGLWQVKKILNKHEYAILNTSADGDFFRQELILYYK